MDNKYILKLLYVEHKRNKDCLINIDGKTFCIGGSVDSEYAGMDGEGKYNCAVEVKFQGELLFVKETFILLSEDLKITIGFIYNSENEQHKKVRKKALENVYLLTDFFDRKCRKVIISNYIEEYDYNSDEIPIAFKKRIKLFKEDFLRITGNGSGKVLVDEIVGTHHTRYCGVFWIEAFIKLQRISTILDVLLDDEVVDKYHKNIFNCSIDLSKVDDDFYVSCDGNHRVITAKILGIDYIANNYKIYRTDRKYKRRYEFLCGQGFKIDLYKNSMQKFQLKFKQLKYRWEVFVIDLDSTKIELAGLDEINEFIKIYKMFDTKSTADNRKLNKLRIFSILCRFGLFEDCIKQKCSNVEFKILKHLHRISWYYKAYHNLGKVHN